MGVTAKARARTALTAELSLSGDKALDVVKAATGDVKGGGASLLTSGLQNLGAEVHVEKESTDRLHMSITSGKRIVELCTFSAVVQADNGVTNLTVGGLETYKTNQQKLFYFIPVSPKSIAGIGPYKRFLQEVEAQLQQADPEATIFIGDAEV